MTSNLALIHDGLARLMQWPKGEPTSIEQRLAELDRWLALGASLEHRDSRGRTALLAALDFDQRPDRTHLSAEHRAKDAQQMVVVLALLDLGACADVVGPNGSALLLAISPLGWRSGVVDALVQRGATLVCPAPTRMRPAPMDEEHDGLTRAVCSGEIGLVERCIALGENVNRPGALSWWSDAPDARLTPLIMAVAVGFVAAIDRLVAAGASVPAALAHPFWPETLDSTYVNDPDHDHDPEYVARLRRLRVHLEQQGLRQLADRARLSTGGDVVVRSRSRL